jgi:flagellar FliL protein
MTTPTQGTDIVSDEEPKKKKKKGKLGKLLVMGGGVLLLAGGGAGAGLYLAQSGLIGGGSKAHAAEDPDKPQLVPKGSKPKVEGEEAKSEPSGEGAKYESSYFQMEKEFTSNLRDSVHFIQVGLAISTNYDERVIANLQAHELAVRSSVLMALSETDEEEIFTAPGKRALQKRLVTAINQVLREKEGFGGVGNVYFTNFIVQ